MKILFSMRHLGFVRNFESVLRFLAQRGHEIRIVFEREGRFNENQLLEELTRAYPSISYEEEPRSGLTLRVTQRYPWLVLAREIRSSLDYLQYLRPRYDDAPRLRARGKELAPSSIQRLTASPLVRRRIGVQRLTACLRMIERATPSNPQITEFIAHWGPDLIMVTPLLWFGSGQVDYVRSAKALGIPSVLCVGSWDHLTSKGVIHETPESVVVWNEGQKTEAWELHGISSERVVVTGAYTYDHWFEWQPRPRKEFCQLVGLASERPFILYVCSSSFIAPQEAKFVQNWVQQLRASSDARLRTAGILIRPHPQNVEEWRRADFSGFEHVVIWPREGANPVSAEAKADFFDSLYHSKTVVGLNTSAQIEAGIVGRPVHTLLVPEFAGSQEGTLHFHHLLPVNGGLLHVARDFHEHIAQLIQALSGEGDAVERSRKFVATFVRPHGLEIAATPLVVETIERLGRQNRPRPLRPPLWVYPLRLLLYPLALLRAVAVYTKIQRKKGRRIGVLQTVIRLLGTGARRKIVIALHFLLTTRPGRMLVKKHLIPQSLLRRVKRSIKGAPKGKGEEKTKTKERAKVEAKAHLPVLALENRKVRGAEREEIHTAKKAIRTLAQSGKPIIIGPWLGEVGFELLYWIPFLHWAKTYGALPEERLIIVSRGGVAAWYQHLSARYWDIFEHYTPEEFRANNAQRMVEQGGNEQKQLIVSAVDQEIIARVKHTLHLDDIELLHPSVMYPLFRPFWRNQAPLSLVEQLTSFRPLPSINVTDLVGRLPEDYVAVKFYTNNSFPDTAENRTFLSALLQDLTRRTDVVLLDTGFWVDDHRDFRLAATERLHTIDHLVVPSNNLAVQTQIISRARAFVGTYGGFSYLAPLYRVDSLAFYSHPKNFLTSHLDLARRVFTNLEGGSFVALDTRELDILRVALGSHMEWRPLSTSSSKAAQSVQREMRGEDEQAFV